MMYRTLVLAALLASPFMINAQSTKKALAEANAAFAGAVQFKVDLRDRLIMDCFDDGERYRQDIALLKELNVDSIFWSEGEEAIVLNCIAGKTKCFSKEVFKLDMVRLTARSNIPTPPSDPKGEQAIVVLKGLIRTAQAELADLPNATQEKSSRTKTR